jgi:hypothetical protein
MYYVKDPFAFATFDFDKKSFPIKKIATAENRYSIKFGIDELLDLK